MEVAVTHSTTEIKYSSTKKQSKQSEATEKLRFNGSFARNGNKKYDFFKTSWDIFSSETYM